MDQPVVDWKAGTAPEPYERRTTPFPPPPPASAEILRWATIAGVAPPLEGNIVRIKMSTAPVEHWIARRSKLAPQTTDIEVEIHRDRWYVKLTRLDNLFCVNWSSGGNVAVRSDQMKYQRLVRWPALDAIENFPLLVKAIETLLGIQFISYADVNLAKPSKQFIKWLEPCAKKVGR